MNGDAARRLRLTIAYDGRPFRGWQSQAGGGTVQDHLEAAFGELAGGPVSVQGSGRTDAGVHALAQQAHVDLPRCRGLAPSQWQAAINHRLPPEIRLLHCRWARPGFHARFDARGKIYRYRIWNGPVLPPLEVGRAWHLFTPLALEALRHAAAPLSGRHDFGGFAANRGGPPEPDTVRTLRRIAITGRTGSLITLTFEGDGFLYRMVRLLTGSLVRCAQGKASRDWITRLLAPPAPGATREKTSFAAPADGLYLARVLYGVPGVSAVSRSVI